MRTTEDLFGIVIIRIQLASAVVPFASVLPSASIGYGTDVAQQQRSARSSGAEQHVRFCKQFTDI
jgi:hypothetical protein